MENTIETNISASVSTSSSQEVKTSGRPKAVITRNTDDKIIAGVCSGIANYYDIDPVIVRLIAGMGFLTFGVGPLIYILLWIILPAKAQTIQPAATPEGLSPAA